MFDEPELFWLGILLWLGVTVWLLAQRGANSKPQPEASLPETDKPPTPEIANEIERLREQCRRLQENLERQSALSNLSETGKLPTPEAADQLPTADEIEQLQEQCRRLREELEQQSAQLYDDFRAATFAQLQSLLVSLPTARCMARAKPSWPAKNLISLFSPLEQLWQSWGYDCIGEVWEQVPYDPQLHQPDADDIASGELVYVRFVGYRNGDRILCPAKVSRTLPSSHAGGNS